MASIFATIILSVVVTVVIAAFVVRLILKEAVGYLDGAVEELTEIHETMVKHKQDSPLNYYYPELPAAIHRVKQARSLLGGSDDEIVSYFGYSKEGL